MVTRIAKVLAALLLVCLCLAIGAREVSAKGKGSRGKRTKRHLGALDKDYHLLRDKCAAEMQEEEEKDPECIGSDVKRENCILRCVSPECYEKLYGNDPLEEGELDTTRGRLFRTCVRTSKRKEKKEEQQKDEI